MTLKMVKAKNAEIQTEAFGNPGDPPVLLIMGMMASMLWWPNALCAGLARQGRYVIRYDNRDTGLSTHWPQGAPGYGSSDMVDDAIAVLDGYGLDSAHIVGMSMGGMIAQRVALGFPQRTRSVTIISSSPLGVEDLPGCTEAYSRHAADGEKVDWSDPDAMAAYIRRDCAMLAGTRHPHDAQAAAALIARDMARTPNYASATNHFALLDESDGSPRAAAIERPLLAIHGTADPLFPIAHGEAFVRVVPGARLVPIEGGGHEIHALDVDQYVTAIAHHTA